MGSEEIPRELAYLRVVVQDAADIASRWRNPSIKVVAPHWDWDTLCNLAARTVTMPLINWHFKTRGINSPPWLGNLLRASHAYHHATNHELLAELALIGEQFRAAGVRSIVRRGPDVSRLYPMIACRPFGDLDLLVDPDDIPHAVSVLSELGFRQHLSRKQRAFLRIASSTVALRRTGPEGNSTDVDLSTSIFLRAQPIAQAGFSFASCYQRSVPFLPGLAAFDAADALIDLVTNLFITSTTLRYIREFRFQRLTPYIDLLLTAGQMDISRWAHVEAEVQRLGIERETAFAVENCGRLFPLHQHLPILVAHLGGFQMKSDIDTFGQWDMTSPVQWHVDITRRLFMRHLPAYVPDTLTPL